MGMMGFPPSLLNPENWAKIIDEAKKQQPQTPGVETTTPQEFRQPRNELPPVLRFPIQPYIQPYQSPPRFIDPYSAESTGWLFGTSLAQYPPITPSAPVWAWDQPYYPQYTAQPYYAPLQWSQLYTQDQSTTQTQQSTSSGPPKPPPEPVVRIESSPISVLPEPDQWTRNLTGYQEVPQEILSKLPPILQGATPYIIQFSDYGPTSTGKHYSFYYNPFSIDPNLQKYEDVAWEEGRANYQRFLDIGNAVREEVMQQQRETGKIQPLKYPWSNTLIWDESGRGLGNIQAFMARRRGEPVYTVNSPEVQRFFEAMRKSPVFNRGGYAYETYGINPYSVRDTFRRLAQDNEFKYLVWSMGLPQTPEDAERFIAVYTAMKHSVIPYDAIGISQSNTGETTVNDFWRRV
ncbi:MAG: hypothetical protein QW815_07865 [Nitrososphaerota archaeon]